MNKVAVFGSDKTPSPDQSPDASRKTRGPSQQVTDAVLQATLDLMMEAGARLSVDAIAQRSGVNKTTLYRRWGGLMEIVKAAIASVDMREQDFTDSGSLQSDLQAISQRFAAHFSKPIIVAIIRLVVTSRNQDRQFADWIDEYWLEREQLYYVIVDRALARGERVQRDRLPLAIEMMTGPMLMRLLVNDTPLDQEMTVQLAQSAFHYLSE